MSRSYTHHMAGATPDHAQLVSDAGLNRPARRVTFTPKAVSDLESLKRPTKALLERAVRDILLEPTGGVQVTSASVPPGYGPAERWFQVPVGRFRVVFRTQAGPSDGADAERIVACVQRAQDSEREDADKPLGLSATLG